MAETSDYGLRLSLGIDSPLVLLVRRHEETAKFEKPGKDKPVKGDEPTFDAQDIVYSRGKELRGVFGEDYDITASHSTKASDTKEHAYDSDGNVVGEGHCLRSRIAANLWLEGAGVVSIRGSRTMGTYDFQSTIFADKRLDSIDMSAPCIDVEEVRKMRNIADETEKMGYAFTALKPELLRTGIEIAKFVVEMVEGVNYGLKTGQLLNEKFGPRKRAHVAVSHGPVIDCGLLTLLGIPVTYENAVRNTGIYSEGMGFNAVLGEDGMVNIDTGLFETTLQFRDLKKNVSQAEANLLYQ